MKDFETMILKSLFGSFAGTEGGGGLKKGGISGERNRKGGRRGGRLRNIDLFYHRRGTFLGHRFRSGESNFGRLNSTLG